MATGLQMTSNNLPKTIPGFSRYQAYPDGRIECVKKGNTGRWRVPFFLKMNYIRKQGGYRIVSLWDDDGRKRSIFHHMLVALAFLGPRNGMQVRHKDGSKTNNHIENLCYGTHKDNARDRTQHGKTYRGEKIFGAKLTSKEVKKIRLARSLGFTRKAIAENFAVSEGAIDGILSGKNWRHVK